MANDFSLIKYNELKDKGYNSDEIREYFVNQNIDLVFWNDHVAEFADVRVEKILGEQDEANPDGTHDQIVKHTRFDGNILMQGTPVNAEHLGQMEWNDLINWMNILELKEAIKALKIKLDTFMGQSSNNMPYNQFVVSAKDLRGPDANLMMIEGWYDEVNGRGVV